MARMLARVSPVQCSICRNSLGLDCIDVGKSKTQVRLAGRNETQRETDLYMEERRDRNKHKVVENYFE